VKIYIRKKNPVRLNNFSQFSTNRIIENLIDISPIDPKLYENFSKSELDSLLQKLKFLCNDKGADFQKVCQELKLRDEEIPESVKKSKITSVVRAFLDNGASGYWKEESNGKIKVDGSFVLTDSGVLKSADKDGIPYDLEFGEVTRIFQVSGENFSNFRGFPAKAQKINLANCKGVTSLEDFPTVVENEFNCSGTSIQNLKGGPQNMVLEYNVKDCDNLTSLEGAPEEVGSFDCRMTPKLKTLEGSLKKVQSLYCGHNLESFKGCPEEITKNFEAPGNNNIETLISLKGSLKTITKDTRFNLYGCGKLWSLEGIPLTVNERNIQLGENFYPIVVLKMGLKLAIEWGNWPCAYLQLLTEEKWTRLGKAQRDVLRNLLFETPYLKGKAKEISKIYKDPIFKEKAIQTAIKKAGLTDRDFKNIDLHSELSDYGL
jgi:hypothetical protein